MWVNGVMNDIERGDDVILLGQPSRRVQLVETHLVQQLRLLWALAAALSTDGWKMSYPT